MANTPLKTIKFPGLNNTYTVPQIDATLSTSGKAADAKATGDALSEKPDTVGYYESLVSGGATQIISDDYTSDESAYTFRKTGGDLDVGDREYLRAVVGGSFGWNQLVQNGNFADTSGWSTYLTTLSVSNNIATVTVDGNTAASANISHQVSVTSGHKFLLCFDVKQINGTKVLYYIDDGGSKIEKTITQGVWVNIATIRSASSNASTLYLYPEPVVENQAQFENVVVTDLTTLFGSSTIADYIYSLEQATAGAGVAWLKKYCPKLFDYNAYDAGSIKSVEGLVSHDTVGKNQVEGYFPRALAVWDNAVYLGGLSGETAGTTIYFRCVAGQTYFYSYFDGDTHNRTYWGAYDHFPSYGDFTEDVQNGGATFTPRTTGYCCLYLKNVVDEDLINYQQVELGTVGTAYESYRKRSYPLDSTVTLRGIPKLVNGALQFDGDIYPPSGEGRRRYGIVDLGTLEWDRGATSESGVYRMQTSDLAALIKKTSSSAAIGNLMCGKYITTNLDSVYGKTKGVSVSSLGVIAIFDENYSGPTSMSDFKTAMSGVYLVYELAEPTTFIAEPYQELQIIDHDGTEEFVSTSLVPVCHKTDYIEDLKAKLVDLPAFPTTAGTYKLKVELINGVLVRSWISDS